MADWAMRVIQPYVNEVIVCEPRHNRLISEGDDKHDDIDPGNLIKLYRVGELKAVHHPERQSMMDLRGWVWAYHDQVELVTAAKNKIKAALRSVGIQYGQAHVYSVEDRSEWLGKLPRKSVRERVEMFYGNLDDLRRRRDVLHDRLTRIAQRHPVARRFLAIPGYGPVRAMTFLVMVDTPLRFPTRQKLWRYSGLGLRRHQSGDPKRGKLLPPVCYNRRLKAVARGAMEIALAQGNGNPFERYCQHLIDTGVKEPLARLSTARKMLTVPWGMWRGGTDYNPALVFRN